MACNIRSVLSWSAQRSRTAASNFDTSTEMSLFASGGSPEDACEVAVQEPSGELTDAETVVGVSDDPNMRSNSVFANRPVSLMLCVGCLPL